LLRLATSLTGNEKNSAALTAMHISPTNELHQFDIEEYEKEVFEPVLEASAQMQQPIATLFKASADIDNEITSLANKGDYDLLLIEMEESIYEGSFLGKLLGFTTRIINPEKLLNTVTGKENLFDNSNFDEGTRLILSKSTIPVGVFVDKKFEKAEHICIPFYDEKDSFLITYAQKFIRNSGAQVVILDTAGHIKNNLQCREKITAAQHASPNHILLITQTGVEKEFLKQQDLILISTESWKKMVESKSRWLQSMPSTLIISGKTGDE
jgi:hypothetical protein